MNANNNSVKKILGLDLGTNSVGWAIVEYAAGEPQRLLDMGVRVFDAGVTGDIESGKDESRAVARRNARLARRQTERRARRHTRIALTLQELGLLPQGDLADSETRDEILKTLDRELYSKYAQQLGGKLHPLDQLPYFLRARALAHPLDPLELGRALYHLGQRRGFLSNRQAPGEDEEEEGKVKQGIIELNITMDTAGARTLGEYFAQLNPHEARIRGRWTSRAMYADEFDAIWAAQASHHPSVLTAEGKKKLHRAIFFQRPLKSQKHLIGECRFEEKRKRAPWALLAAQRFRLLQRVNDLRIVSPDGLERALAPDERTALLDVLESQQTLTFKKAATILKLPKGSEFSHERGGEEKLVGNISAAKLLDLFGGRWHAFSQKDKDQIVEDILTMEKEEALQRRGMKAWGLDQETAGVFARMKLQPDYCNLSRQALAKLLPLMETGMAYASAVKQVYGDGGVKIPPRDLLCMLDESPIVLRNPVVRRTLNELRRVVNAIIEKHGKPDLIRIELARDMKNTREDRKEIWKKNRENQKQREWAAHEVTKENRDPHPTRDDILKVLLAEECNWECPYTGKSISRGALVGSTPQFDIEHIIPYSRCLDNSFMNKTLCYHEANRAKGNRTPFETYAHDPQRWQDIIARVGRFKGDGRTPKLRRFQTQDLDDFDTFSSRQLNDTRYASTLAADYLGLLYGGQIDPDGRRRIQAGRGQVTSELRNAWHLNGILADDGKKSRDDHRHHAVDAVAIALTDPKTVQMLSRAASKARDAGKRGWWKEITEPWLGFLKEVTHAVENVTVSHKVSRKVNGPLHEETYYSPQHKDDNGKPCVHVRKRVDSLSAGDVSAIVDPKVRKAVETAIAAAGDIKKLGLAGSTPFLTTKNGRCVPIRKVRIRKTMSSIAIGMKGRMRHVAAGSNHHMEIIEITDKRGDAKWEDIIVSRYEAMRRLRRGEPIVQCEHGDGKRFMCSLAPGDVVEMELEKGKREPFVIRSISKDLVNYVRITDARLKKDIMASKEWGASRLNFFRKAELQKMVQDPLGRLCRAND